MNNLSTAIQLAKWTMEQYDGYEPLPSAIHILLNKHGINTHIKYFNNKPVKLYNTKNAQRTIAQNFEELNYWDEQCYIKLLKKESINNIINNVITETINHYLKTNIL